MTTQCSTWCEKYRPKKFEEIYGQDLAIEKIKKYIADFNLGRLTKKSKKAMILNGPPGVGKTTLAHVFANEIHAEIFELNASDLRNKPNLQEVLKPAMQQKSLFAKKKIILVDEVDGISGYYDRGGVNELIALITLSNYPVIITANNIYKKNLSSLRKKAELIELKELTYNALLDVMLNILRKENLFVNQEILKSIASRAKGDIRAAVNDLQSVARMQDPSIITLDERNKQKDIFKVLQTIFKDKPEKEMTQLFDSVNMNLDEIILWFEENIQREYSGRELARAYELLAKVDLFRGRIYKQQYWRFMVYENIFLSYGISSAKKTSNKNFTKYQKPSRILKIWLNNQRTAKKKSIAQKYAAFVHVGTKRAMHEFPIIKQILKSNSQIQKELKLNEDEIEYLRN